MVVRMILGVLITLGVLAVAGRRAKFLSDLIHSGQPVDRFDHLGSRLWAQVKEVFGQRKLLKWSIPGAAHAFTFWGFVILASVYLEAYGALFDPDFHIPLIGQLGRARLRAGLHRGDGARVARRVRDHPPAATRRSASSARPASTARTPAARG